MRMPAVCRLCVIVTNLPPPVPRNTILKPEFMITCNGDEIILLYAYFIKCKKMFLT